LGKPPIVCDFVCIVCLFNLPTDIWWSFWSLCKPWFRQ